MSKEDFHIPFLQSMVIIASVTLVSMVLSRILIEKYLVFPQKSVEFTSAPLGLNTK
jgi:hypothetical protein